MWKQRHNDLMTKNIHGRITIFSLVLSCKTTQTTALAEHSCSPPACELCTLLSHHCFSFDIVVMQPYYQDGGSMKPWMLPHLKDRTSITEQTSVVQHQLLRIVFIAQSGLQTTWMEYFLKIVHIRDWPQAKASIGVFLLASAAFGCNPLMHNTRGSSNSYKNQQKGLHWLLKDIGPFCHLHIDLPTSSALRFSTPCGFLALRWNVL